MSIYFTVFVFSFAVFSLEVSQMAPEEQYDILLFVICLRNTQDTRTIVWNNVSETSNDSRDIHITGDKKWKWIWS